VFETPHFKKEVIVFQLSSQSHRANTLQEIFLKKKAPLAPFL